jgi:hypothetical protein
VFPNPFVTSESGAPLSFLSQNPDHAIKQIRLFTAAGEEIRVLFPDSEDGRSAHWDGGNEAGYLVGSGIYLYVVRTLSGEVLTGKLAVIR